MNKVDGKGGISATVVADSISEAGKRVTTFELEYPRFVHSEMMTHRLFSRNAASSRAIPVNKMIEHVENNTAMPIHWGKNQPGMQAKEECDELVESREWDGGIFKVSREAAWKDCAENSAEAAMFYAEAGYHKQIVNRLLEPFQFIKVVCTATEFDNFFWLRKHPDAQPEIAELARAMWEAREQSKPMLLKAGEWHVPYVYSEVDTIGRVHYYEKLREDGTLGLKLSVEDALKISASCCAQVSYRLTDHSLEKALKIYDMLVNSKPVHASPFEHQATPMKELYFEESPDAYTFGYFEGGVTHVNINGEKWSGNFRGWIQHRQLIPENTCWNYEG